MERFLNHQHLSSLILSGAVLVIAFSSSIKSIQMLVAANRNPKTGALCKRVNHDFTEYLIFYGAISFLFLIFEFGGSQINYYRLENRLPIISFLLGAITYLFVLAFYGIYLRVFWDVQTATDESVNAIRIYWPRTNVNRIKGFIAVGLLNPIFEEWIYRGVLIGVLGGITGYYKTMAAMSLALNLLSHLYQGWKNLVFHIIFQTGATLIFLSPLGLIGSIGFHFAGDLVPLYLFPRNLKDYYRRRKARHRERLRGLTAA
ncbi:MAG: CPBP family intramembrane glutamic endopeptidase [Pyrinomonadaceae bacterium]